jgi:type I restriction-modification system DNA methylase subunit
MTLFQNSVLRNYLQNQDVALALQAYEVYKTDFLPKIANIKSSKEEQYQYGFLDDLFVKVLGYTLNPTPDYNLIAEQKNLSDSKKTDGAVLKEGKVIAVIELKSTKTKSMDKIVNQAFGYKHNHPTCKYIITSNFEKLRFYVEHSDKYEEFNLFELDEQRFTLLYTLLNKESIFADVPLTLKSQSKLQEENISNELYRKYATLRTNLFDNIIQNNPSIDKHILLEKTQTILDRMVFIFFGEDRGILPPNTIKAIIDHYKGDIEDRELWHFYKIYFNAINKGNAKLNIPEYNGGLFAPDVLLDEIIIDNEVIEECPLALSAYDFNSEIDVNILGHIFENSLNDIEELKARINDDSFDATQSKRKKDGVFYTPEYITKYIVDNTLGSLCQAKKEELGLDEVEIDVPKNPKKLNKTQSKQKEALEAYRAYLLGLKILDPACGSGAFLNQALNYLLEEHAFIDESIKTLMGGSVLGLYDVKKGILENNLYGVDINAEAVEIAKLSLWLRTVESGRKLNKLANKIKVGNSLIDDKSVADDAFVWEEEFAEVFEQGGFDCVMGNPPYVRSELIQLITPFLQRKYQVFHSAGDLFSYFYELGVSLLNEKGIFGFISNAFDKTTAAEPLRNFIANQTNIKKYIDFKAVQVFHGATTYPIILILDKQYEKQNTFEYIQIPKEKQSSAIDIDHNKMEAIAQDFLEGKNWSFLSNTKFNILNKLKKHDSVKKLYGKCFYGVKTALNDAFVTENLLSLSEQVKLIYEGKDLSKWSSPNSNKKLILFPRGFTKDRYGEHIDEITALSSVVQDFPELMELLLPLEERAKKRYDQGDFWWELRNCAYYDLFEKPKIVFPNLQNSNKFCFDSENIYVLAPAVFLPTDDRALLAILNSKLIWFFLTSICVVRSGGYIEVKPQYFEQIPIALPTEINKKRLEELSEHQIIKFDRFHMQSNKFLKRVKDNFNLDKLSKKLEAFYKHDFKTFLAELKKKKVILSLVQQDEWEEYFESYQEELTTLQTQIDNTDKQIDKMVYELYGLSEDEVCVVEGRDG